MLVALAAALAETSPVRQDAVQPIRTTGLGETEAVSILAALTGEPQPWQVQLQALNALTALGETARPALPALERAAQSQQEYVRNAGRYICAVLKGEYRPDYPVFDLARMMGRAG